MKNNNLKIPILKDCSKNHHIKLNPYWIVGFTDADGSFQITKTPGNSFRLEYKVTQKNTSNDVICALKDFFNCGRINIDNRKFETDKFVVTNLHDLVTIIIPFFEAHNLVTSKYLNFKDFREAAFILFNARQSNTELSISDYILIENLKSGKNDLRPYLDRFNHCNSVTLDLLNNQWVSGFIDGEGSFEFTINENIEGTNNKSPVIQPGFELKQSTHDSPILELIIKFLGYGYIVYPSSNKEDIMKDLRGNNKSISKIRIRKIKELDDLIKKLSVNRLWTNKYLDFCDWVTLIEAKKKGLHKTKEGLEYMKKIKALLNRPRPTISAR